MFFIEVTLICAQFLTAGQNAIYEGRFGDASRILEDSRACVESREPDDPSRINHSILLATAYQWLGRTQEADKLYASIPFDASTSDEDMILLVAKVWSSRGGLRTGEARWQEAETFLIDALALFKTPFLRSHRAYSQVKIQLGQLYQLQGAFELAEPLLAAGVEALRRDPIEVFDTDLLIAESSLGRLYDLMHRDQQAHALLSTSYDRARRESPNHSITAECALNLAVYLREHRELDRAIPLLKVAEKIYLSADGQLHAGLIAVHLEYAAIASSENQLEKASTHLKKAMELLNMLFGPEHPLMADSKRSLAAVYRRQKKNLEANALLEEARRTPTPSAFTGPQVRR